MGSPSHSVSHFVLQLDSQQDCVPNPIQSKLNSGLIFTSPVQPVTLPGLKLKIYIDYYKIGSRIFHLKTAIRDINSRSFKCIIRCISTNIKEFKTHTQVCFTLGWSSVVFALCSLQEKKRWPILILWWRLIKYFILVFGFFP